MSIKEFIKMFSESSGFPSYQYDRILSSENGKNVVDEICTGSKNIP